MREHAFDAHPDEIAVLAVVADPLFELSLVCALDQAAIDMSMIPAVAEPAEAFTKTPGVPGRISEGEPDDLCRFVLPKPPRSYRRWRWPRRRSK